MHILNPEFSIEKFFQRLSKTTHALLMLDFDGTLAPFVVNPEEAVLYPGIRERLEELIKAQNTTLVIISGRPIANLIPLIPLSPLPELWGSHGGEQLTSQKEYIKQKISPESTKALQQALKSIQQSIPEARVEMKAASLAIHWRGKEEEMHQQIEMIVRDLAKNHSLIVKSFNGGQELYSTEAATKEMAVKNLLTKIPIEMPIAYLGDDLTDEDAFKSIGEKGLKVFVSHEKRPTRADIQIEPPEELLSFLDQWLESQRNSYVT